MSGAQPGEPVELTAEERFSCLLCRGRRHVGWFSAVCETCGVVQRTPEGERLHQAVQQFKRALLGIVRR